MMDLREIPLSLKGLAAQQFLCVALRFLRCVPIFWKQPVGPYHFFLCWTAEHSRKQHHDINVVMVVKSKMPFLHAGHPFWKKILNDQWFFAYNLRSPPRAQGPNSCGNQFGSILFCKITLGERKIFTAVLQLAKSILESTLAILSHILATRRHESLRNGRMAGTARVAHHRDARSALGAVRVSRSAAEQAVSLSHGTAVESTTGSARSLEPQKPEKPSCRTECSSNDSHYDGKTSEWLKSASQFTRIETAPEDRSFESWISADWLHSAGWAEVCCTSFLLKLLLLICWNILFGSPDLTFPRPYPQPLSLFTQWADVSSTSDKNRRKTQTDARREFVCVCLSWGPSIHNFLTFRFTPWKSRLF